MLCLMPPIVMVAARAVAARSYAMPSAHAPRALRHGFASRHAADVAARADAAATPAAMPLLFCRHFISPPLLPRLATPRRLLPPLPPYARCRRHAMPMPPTLPSIFAAGFAIFTPFRAAIFH